MQKKIPVIDLKIDSAVLVNGSLVITGIDTTAYEFNYANNKIFWKEKISLDSVSVKYRIFPRHISVSIRNADIRSAVNIISLEKKKKPSSQLLKHVSGIEYSGVFGRSVSMGNTQNATVNSQMSLELKGMIGDSIQVQASITDNNALVQPYGYTKQLNEFDRIQIQFKKGGRELRVGDIDLSVNHAPYLNLNKRIQGFSYFQNSKGKKENTTTQLSTALSKGKYARNIFQGAEGNQGPYRLKGNDRDLFLIVLAGSEKVFLNGDKLERGLEADYVIDYNTAELSFTSKNIITKDSRIQIEFEYADRNYLNYLLYFTHEVRKQKQTIRASVYSTTDVKHSPLNTILNNQQKHFLTTLGDNIENAFYTNAVADSFDAGRIMYAKKDTIINGKPDSFYVYSTDRNRAQYILSFSETGTNKGNYVREVHHTNGYVYKWIAPVNGVPQGNYEPAQFLVTPKKQQIAALSFSFTPDSLTSVHTDIAFSKNDRNTFSNTHSDRTVGGAFKFSAVKAYNIKSSKNLFVHLTGNAEYINSYFNSPERIRDIEFLRMWGLPLAPGNVSEQLTGGGIAFKKYNDKLLSYRFQKYKRGNNYEGDQHVIENCFGYKLLQLKTSFLHTQYQSSSSKGAYIKPSLRLTLPVVFLNNAVIGVEWESERSVRRGGDDALFAESFDTRFLNVLLRSGKNHSIGWNVSYAKRINQSPVLNRLFLSDKSENYTAGFSLSKHKIHSAKFDLIYRRLTTYSVQETIDNSILSHAEYGFIISNGLVKGELMYETGTGREPARNVSYFEVPVGRGDYAWFDYKNDGIQQLNEFERALFPDQAKFVRWYLPADNYIKTQQTQFRYSVSLNGTHLRTTRGSGHSQFLKRFTVQSSLQMNYKQKAGRQGFYFPLKYQANDTNTVLSSINTNHNLSFNRNKGKWGMELCETRSINKMLLNYGLESRATKELSLKERIQLSPLHTLELVQSIQTLQVNASQFINADYAIRAYKMESKITSEFSRNSRGILGFEKLRKYNAELYGGEAATFHNVYAEVKWNFVENAFVNSKVMFENINYHGKNGSALSYAMLNGLMPGKNYLWKISLSKRIFKSIEASLQYDGRKSPSTFIIHTGSASFRAVL